MPFFSIIIPVYNTEKYLKQCILSILNQSFNDYEIIIVDDGSVDNCGLMCDYYARIDNRIIVMHQKNLGPFEARGNASQKATGQYILSIDSDDWIEVDALKKIHDLLFERNIDVLIFNYQKVFDDNSAEKQEGLLNECKVYNRNEILGEAIFTEKLNNICTKAVRA